MSEDLSSYATLDLIIASLTYFLSFSSKYILQTAGFDGWFYCCSLGRVHVPEYSPVQPVFPTRIRPGIGGTSLPHMTCAMY